MALFITFEGVEGSGKSTQMNLLEEHLRQTDKRVLCVREPGGTALGEKVREILLNPAKEKIDPLSELFLYEACRAQLISQVIRPALTDGITVLCDRFTDSTIAYQGWGRGLDIDAVCAANELATGGLKPDVTLILDCEAGIGLKRAWTRINGLTEKNKEDRFEKEGLIFHERVRKGYLAIAQKEPERVHLIDASVEIPLIHRAICDIIKKAG